MSIQAYTDGSCSPNPGPGGWGWLWFSDDSKVIFTSNGGSKKATNNRMELFALIDLLENLRPLDLEEVNFYIDSKYVLNSLVSGQKQLTFNCGEPIYTGYAKRWGMPLVTKKNADLWKALHLELRKWSNKNVNLYFHWVRGHSGDPGNDLADKLAKEGTPKSN